MAPAAAAVLFLLPILHSDAIPVYGRRRRALPGHLNEFEAPGAIRRVRQAVRMPVMSEPPGNGA